MKSIRNCYGELGTWYEPHWEVYPGTLAGDTNRIAMNDTGELMESIALGLHSYSVTKRRKA